jgi:hypothetical protein
VALAQLESGQTTAGEGPETTARATAEEEAAGGVSSHPEGATETKAEVATETKEETGTETLPESEGERLTQETSREGRVAKGTAETDSKIAKTGTKTENEPQTAEAAYREANAYAVLSSPDLATREAGRTVLGNNVTEFTARVQEVADALHQPGKSTTTKVGEVMASQANRLISEGHRDVVVQGLRQVEQAMAAQGDTRLFLPAQGIASISDQMVTDAFAEVAKNYLIIRDGRRPATINSAVQGSSLAAVMDAVTRVVRDGLRENPQGKGSSSATAHRLAKASLFTQGALQVPPSSSTEQAPHADASFGNTPGSPSPSSEPSQEERHAERARLHARIPEGRDWISRMLKLTPQSALHEIARKAATLIDLVLDIDYDRPEFNNRKHFKELLFTDKPDPTQDNLGTDDYGRYEGPGKGPAQIHTSNGSPHKLITSLHEIGHHLAKMLGAAAENNLANAHKGTRRYQSIVDNMTPKRAEYFNSGEEVFARAFAQLVVERIGHRDPELSREFVKMSKDADEQYKTWRPADFAGVRDVLMKELEKAQWTLRPTK